MAVIKGTARQTSSVDRKSEGSADVYMRMLRDGTISVADFIGVMSLEGRVFTANAGSATTPITFGDGGLDTTEFDLHVAVPAGVAIIPIELSVAYETFGTASLTETCLVSGKGSTTGAGTAVTPVSSNTNTGLSSACTITSAATATSGVYFTSETKEIYRDTDQLTITIATVAQVRVPYMKVWRAKDAGDLHVVGPSAQLAVFAAAQAGTGMIAMKYIELPSSAV